MDKKVFEKKKKKIDATKTEIERIEEVVADALINNKKKFTFLTITIFQYLKEKLKLIKIDFKKKKNIYKLGSIWELKILKQFKIQKMINKKN